jgi:hypothetical protein
LNQALNSPSWLLLTNLGGCKPNGGIEFFAKTLAVTMATIETTIAYQKFGHVHALVMPKFW